MSVMPSYITPPLHQAHERQLHRTKLYPFVKQLLDSELPEDKVSTIIIFFYPNVQCVWQTVLIKGMVDKRRNECREPLEIKNEPKDWLTPKYTVFKHSSIS